MSATSDHAQSFADRLDDIRRASLSSYIVIVQQALVTDAKSSSSSNLQAPTNPAFPRSPPHSVPASPIAGTSLASYAIDATTVIVAQGQLEDGGFEALRQHLLHGVNVVQYVVVKFCGRIAMVQCVGADVSAVRRARAAVFGRSLAHVVAATVARATSVDKEGGPSVDPEDIAPIATPAPLVQIVISHPRQLTDPLLRKHMNSTAISGATAAQGGLSVSTSFSSIFPGSNASAVPALSPCSPLDVPQSVSTNSIPFTPAGTSSSMSTLDSAASPFSTSTTATTTHVPFPPIGLGINGVESITDALYEMSKTDASAVTVRADAEESPASLPRMFERPWRRGHRASHKQTWQQKQSDASHQSPLNTAILLSPESNEDSGLSLISFPFPPRRTSHISQTTSSSGGGDGSGRQQAQLSQTSFIEPLSTPSVYRDASSQRLRTSYSSSSLSSFAFLSDRSDTHSIHRRPRRSSNPLDANNDATCRDEEQERLEQERMAFILWRKSQESAMLAKERQREQQRRMKDEATRDRVMRRLMVEQGMSGKAVDARSVSSGRLTDSPMTIVDGGARTPSSKSRRVSLNESSANVNVAKRATVVSQTNRGSSPLAVPKGDRRRTSSSSAGSLPKVPPPGLPLPPIPSSQSVPPGMLLPPLPGSVSARRSAMLKGGGGGGGRKLSIATDQSAPLPLSPLSLQHSPSLSLDFDIPHTPIDARVQEAIKREMRRPVMTMEGHIRPRVQMRPARMRTHSEGVALTCKSLADEQASCDIKGDNVLTRSLIAAQRNCARSAHTYVRNSDMLSPFCHEMQQPGTDEVAVVRTMDAHGHSIGAGWALDLDEKQLPLEPALPQHNDGQDARASVDCMAQTVDSRVDPQERREPERSRPQLSFSSETSEAASLTNDFAIATRYASTSCETSYEQLSPLKRRARSSSNGFPSVSMPTQKATEVATQTTVTTLMDRIFADAVKLRPGSTTPTRPVSKALPSPPSPQSVAVMQDYTQLPIQYWTRELELNSKMDGLKEVHTQRVEAEACARTRWAREQVQRQQLSAYERSRLESDERVRRENAAERLASFERERRAIEAEQRMIAQYEQVRAQRKEDAQMTLAARREREANDQRERAKREKERQRIEAEREKRHSALRKLFSKMKANGCAIAQGVITLQNDDSIKRRRRYYVLRPDGLYLYAEAKAEQVESGEDVRALEVFDVTPGRVVGLSDAFETLQMQHSFSFSIKRHARQGLELRDVVETIFAYTDQEADKEHLVVGLAWLSGLAADAM